MPNYLHFKVAVKGIEPPIEREFLLHEQATFEDLHRAIQDAGGWQDHQFYIFFPEKMVGHIAHKDDRNVHDNLPGPIGANVALRSYFRDAKGAAAPVRRCIYQYGAGNSGWLVDVVMVEKVESAGRFERRLSGGARAFPPEDCGGMSGYFKCAGMVRIADVAADPDWVDSNGLLDWLDGWHPDRFDPASVYENFNR